MTNEKLKLGKHNIVIGSKYYSTEKDHKQAIKDIERVLRILASDSVPEIVMALAKYRKEFAKGEDKCRAQLEEFAQNRYGVEVSDND